MGDTLVRVRDRFPEHVIDAASAQGDDTVVLRREGIVPVLAFLRDDLGFTLPLDVTAVDLIGMAPGKPESRTPPLHPMYHTQTVPALGQVEGHRFEVVYHLRRMVDGALVRLKVPVREDDCVLPSATGVFKGFDWFEREVFDMFGIRFEGHPNLRRILNYPEFIGHPLRKDYPRRGHQPLLDMPGIEADPVPGRDDTGRAP